MKFTHYRPGKNSQPNQYFRFDTSTSPELRLNRIKHSRWIISSHHKHFWADNSVFAWFRPFSVLWFVSSSHLTELHSSSSCGAKLEDLVETLDRSTSVWIYLRSAQINVVETGVSSFFTLDLMKRTENCRTHTSRRPWWHSRGSWSLNFDPLTDQVGQWRSRMLVATLGVRKLLSFSMMLDGKLPTTSDISHMGKTLSRILTDPQEGCQSTQNFEEDVVGGSEVLVPGVTFHSTIVRVETAQRRGSKGQHVLCHHGLKSTPFRITVVEIPQHVLVTMVWKVHHSGSLCLK